MSQKAQGSLSSQPASSSLTVHITGTFTLPSTQEIKLAMHLVVGVSSFSGSDLTLTYSKETDLCGTQYFYGEIGAGKMDLTLPETGINVSGSITGGPAEETDVSGFVLVSVFSPRTGVNMAGSLKLQGSVSSQPPGVSPTVHIKGTFKLPSTQVIELAMHIAVGVASFSGSDVTLTYSKDEDLCGNQYFYGEIGAGKIDLTSAETGINVSGPITGGQLEIVGVSGFTITLVSGMKLPKPDLRL